MTLENDFLVSNFVSRKWRKVLGKCQESHLKFAKILHNFLTKLIRRLKTLKLRKSFFLLHQSHPTYQRHNVSMSGSIKFPQWHNYTEIIILLISNLLSIKFCSLKHKIWFVFALLLSLACTYFWQKRVGALAIACLLLRLNTFMNFIETNTSYD